MFYKAFDTEWNKNASSGGITRGCADWLLRNGYINSIIGVLKGDEPGEFYWGITDDPSKLSKSVYVPIDPTTVLNSMSDDEKSQSLFIGIPCQVAKGVKYRITLLCSGGMRGNVTKTAIDYRYGVKPDNFCVLYSDGTYDLAHKARVGTLRETCKKCDIPYKGDMVVGDLHGTPFNLVETQNALFDEYIKTTHHKELTSGMYQILKLDN